MRLISLANIMPSKNETGSQLLKHTYQKVTETRKIQASLIDEKREKIRDFLKFKNRKIEK